MHWPSTPLSLTSSDVLVAAPARRGRSEGVGTSTTSYDTWTGASAEVANNVLQVHVAGACQVMFRVHVACTPRAPSGMHLEVDAGRARVHKAYRARGGQHRVEVAQVVLPLRTQRARARLEAGCLGREALVHDEGVLHTTRQHNLRRARVAPARRARGRAGALRRDRALPKLEAHDLPIQLGIRYRRLPHAAVPIGLPNDDRGRGGVARALPPNRQRRETWLG